MSEAQSITSIADRKVISTGFQPVIRGQYPFGVTQSRLPDMSGAHSHHYDPKIAYLMAMIAAWAYSDGQTLADKLQYYGFASNTVRHFSVVNQALHVVANGFFVRGADNRVGVLAFRGTEPAAVLDWLTHADASLQPFYGGVIHAGLHANVEAIWGYVDQLLSTASMGSEAKGDGLHSLYITGHGLGAAMAVVAAARLFTNDYDELQRIVKGIYTYGQPMVGDRSFARQCGDRFGDRLFRHVYRQDVVPHLPLVSKGALAHFGQQWVSNSTSTPWALRPAAGLSVVPSSADLVALGRSVATRIPILRSLSVVDSLDDHLPARYIDTCRASLAT